MATVRLTHQGVASLETEKDRETFWDDLVPGFGVRVSGRTGKKTYMVRYRANGKQRRMNLGKHPDITLADARQKARDAIADAQDGEDPQAKRKLRRSADVTFGKLAREVLDAKAETTREATQDERERIYAKDLEPVWADTPVSSIERRDVLRVVEGVVKRGSPIMANRTLRLINLIFNEGLRRGFPTLEANPAHMLPDPAQESRRRRFLDREEIRAVWKALEPENPFTGSVFKLTLLTAQRIGSVCAMRWEDIDDADVWTIPADVFKGKRQHMVPLSPEARAIIDELRPHSEERGYIFPGRADAGVPHMNNTSPALARIRDRTAIPHWTAHDFRRTFRTWATRPEDPDHDSDPKGLGVEPRVADAVLGHKEATLGFERYTGEPERYLLAEKREALKRWGAFVMEAVAGDE